MAEVQPVGRFRLVQSQLRIRNVLAVLISHTPGSVLSISTVRPANSLPREIWPLVPTRFTDAVIHR